MLAVKGLNQFYGGSHTLWDVDLSVPEGSLTCIMGRNGMGKTTLAEMHHGLAEDEHGQHQLQWTRSGTGCRGRARQNRHRIRPSGT